MKIIFLNIWGGKVYEPLMEFMRKHAPTTDFFCLQEVLDSPEVRTVSLGCRANILTDLKATLPSFISYFAPAVRSFDGDISWDFDFVLGNAILARDAIVVSSSGNFPVSEGGLHVNQQQPFPHLLQFLRFEQGDVHYTLANIHGIAHPGSKRDTNARIAQSQKTLDFLAEEKGEKILGGDFNLLPDTESIRMIERAGMRNLIAEYGITTTRNLLSYGLYPEAERQYFADYAFVSPGINVKSFTVPQIDISDHLPLILEVA